MRASELEKLMNAEPSTEGSALLSFKDALLRKFNRISSSNLCALLRKEFTQSTSATSGITAYGMFRRKKRRAK